MIKSFDDLQQYLEADRISLQREKTIRALLFDDIWKFQRLLRKYEYIVNCKRNIMWRVIVRIRLRILESKLGYTIPPNVFGPGLAIAHRGTIVVNPEVKVGANCRLHVCVNIGTQAGTTAEVPEIGNNCYIGPGAKLFGKIILGDNIVIGANAVVNKSFNAGITIGGVPAKIISQKSSDGLLIKGYKG
ncbi:MAG: serine acetyltransferase [Gammaproteobacteria bacterium]|nr:serine acetyltransferase [Gammaproteobacteria bacterium]